MRIGKCRRLVSPADGKAQLYFPRFVEGRIGPIATNHDYSSAISASIHCEKTNNYSSSNAFLPRYPSNKYDPNQVACNSLTCCSVRCYWTRKATFQFHRVNSLAKIELEHCDLGNTGAIFEFHHQRSVQLPKHQSLRSLVLFSIEPNTLLSWYCSCWIHEQLFARKGEAE